VETLYYITTPRNVIKSETTGTSSIQYRVLLAWDSFKT